MKLAFSTLGCPQWSLDQIIDSACSLGYEGVQLRTLLGSNDLVTQIPDPAAVRRRFADAGVEIACLDTSVRVVFADTDAQRAEGKAYLDLAVSLGAPFLRVFPGNPPKDEEHEVSVARAADTLAELAAYAEPRKVTVLLETHDYFATGRRLAEILARVPSPAAAALWDIHHPYRSGEAIAETVSCIGDRLRFVHFKDAREGKLVLPGEGELPFAEFVVALKGIGYDGWISFEWEKVWHPEIPEPEVAFPAFIKAVRPLL